MIQNKKTIIFPDCCKDIYSFENIINLQKKIYNENISILDLSKISFVEPYSMINFLLLGRNYLRKTGSKLELVNIPLAIYQYLIRMDFNTKGIFEIPQKINKKLLLKRSSFSRSVIEITDIPNKERESVKIISAVINLFRRRAQHILKPWFSDRIVNYFVTVISEICQNVFEHSLDSGYLAIQTYKSGQENMVRLVIADSGTGIEGSFNNKKEIKYNSGAELLQMALTTPISSKRNFGYGLCQVNSIVHKLNGNLFLRSNRSSIAMVNNKNQKRELYSFQKNNLPELSGTQISISLIL